VRLLRRLYGQATVLVIASWLSPRTRDVLAERKVSYPAEGGATAMVTYASDDTFNISQENGVVLPWTKTVDLGSGILGGGGASRQAQGDGSADSITCRVVRDGEVVSENTSTGQFAVVTCSNF